uniref:AtC3H23-like CCCH zinc finger domain-containing protein n=1 Tax=Physcomitrium patens TaxID=3218 RepID=A0A2K1JSV2_PHYPA|nr:hypothetical protein PHYPA_014392 [Physcomitrium patens]
MLEFSVRRYMRERSHDWIEGSFAHPRRKLGVTIRRDLTLQRQRVGNFEKGSSQRGDACKFGYI